MRFFLDANILVSVLNKEYPLYPYTARILSNTGSKKMTLVTSTICLAIAFYFAEKKHGQVLAKSKINLLAENLEIADCGKKEAVLASQNKKIHDFEDGLEYYAALHSKCAGIISCDTDDFYFSDIEVLTPELFFKKYI
jgi:predicted nucleic acid-binding protein